VSKYCEHFLKTDTIAETGVCGRIVVCQEWWLPNGQNLTFYFSSRERVWQVRSKRSEGYVWGVKRS